jgi:MFS family permease
MNGRLPWGGLALLTLIYTLNFLDRTLIYILFAPIKKEMVFTDFQLALLGTTSFVMFYTLLGIPFGKLADRVSRKKLIAAGLLTWSVFSGLTGFAQGFWSIFVCRVMVGVGEATLGPAALSLLADWFPAEKRATVQSIYTAGVPLGAAAAFFLGGEFGEAFGWRNTFFLLGFPGVALAAVMLTIDEPTRPGQTAGAPAPESEPVGVGLRALAAEPALRSLVAGYGTLAIASNSISIWLPTFLQRVHGWTLPEIGRMSGLFMLISGGLATTFGGALADRVRAPGPGGRMKFGAGLAAISAPLWLGVLLAPNPTVLMVSWFLLIGFGLAWLGPAAADLSDLAGPNRRGLAVGAYYFVVNAVGYGVAPPLLGRLSDALGSAQDPSRLRDALLVCPTACVIAAALLWVGSSAPRTDEVR